MATPRKQPNSSGDYRCSICRQWVPTSGFHKSKYTTAGLHHACKTCASKLNRKRKLLHLYGLSLEEFEQKMLTQKGLCACCEREILLEGKSTRRACVDHNHKTGEVRDLLCGRCNLAAGHVKDSSYIAERLRNYLLRWGC